MPSGEPPRPIENRHVEPPIALRWRRRASPEGAISHGQRIPHLVFADRAPARDAQEWPGLWRAYGGLTTKIHAVVDTRGLPVRLALTSDEAHDNRLVLPLLSALKSGAMLLADRGFEADWIRAFVSEHGGWANIPPRRNRKEPICFSPHLYRARNLVERFFNKIKQCRRVATRYDKLASNYLAFIQLASVRLWLRVNESTP